MVIEDVPPFVGGVARRAAGVRSRVRFAWVAVLVLFIPATPASALFCPTDQSMSPSQVLEAGLASGNQSYDLAFVAAVQSETITQHQQSVEVELIGVYGQGSAPLTTTVTFSGPGVAGGSLDSFEVGTSYFIPVLAVGPDGETNWTTSCDPISVVEDPDTTAVELAVAADAGGLEFALPRQAAADGSSGPVATILVVAVLLGLFLWTGRRLRMSRVSGTDSGPPQPRAPLR